MLEDILKLEKEVLQPYNTIRVNEIELEHVVALSKYTYSDDENFLKLLQAYPKRFNEFKSILENLTWAFDKHIFVFGNFRESLLDYIEDFLQPHGLLDRSDSKFTNLFSSFTSNRNELNGFRVEIEKTLTKLLSGLNGDYNSFDMIGDFVRTIKLLLTNLSLWIGTHDKLTKTMSGLLKHFKNLTTKAAEETNDFIMLSGFKVLVINRYFNDGENSQIFHDMLSLCKEAFHNLAKVVDKYFSEIKNHIHQITFSVKAFSMDIEDANYAGLYYQSYKHIDLLYRSNQDLSDFFTVLCHEVAHFIYQNLLSKGFKEDFEKMFDDSINDETLVITADDFQELVDHATLAGRKGYMLENTRKAILANWHGGDSTMRDRLEASFLNRDNVEKRNKISPYTSCLQDYIDRGVDCYIPLPSYKGTIYSSTNSEEFFCEALAHMLTIGPRTFDPEVRIIIEKGLNIRLARKNKQV